MSRRIPTKTNLFIGHLSKFERQLTAAVEIAQIGRDATALERMASLGLDSLSDYCEAIRLNQCGERIRAEMKAEELIDSGSTRFAAKALVLLANNRCFSEPDCALSLYSRAQSLTEDPHTAVTIIKMRSVVLSTAGEDHQGAIRELENGANLLASIPDNPILCADYLNALAVECTFVGQLRQARQLCNITTNSPWVRLFPQWNETSDTLSEIEAGCRQRFYRGWRPEPRLKAIQGKTNVLPFTNIPKSAPAPRVDARTEELASLRIEARATVRDSEDKEELQCVIAMRTLKRGPNRSLLMRSRHFAPQLAQKFLDMADRHDVAEAKELEENEEAEDEPAEKVWPR